MAADHPIGGFPRPSLVHGMPDGNDDFADRQGWFEAQASSFFPFRVGNHGFLHSVHRHSHTGHSSCPLSHGCLHDSASERSYRLWFAVLAQHVLCRSSSVSETGFSAYPKLFAIASRQIQKARTQLSKGFLSSEMYALIDPRRKKGEKITSQRPMKPAPSGAHHKIT